MRTNNSIEFTRVNKARARNLFNKGVTLYVQTCNFPEDSRLFTPYNVCAGNLNEGESFDTMVNAFEYYNCNNERGKYATFYIKNN